MVQIAYELGVLWAEKYLQIAASIYSWKQINKN